MLLLLALACAHTIEIAPPPAAPSAVVEAAPSARDLARAARDAESRGDLQRAFDLARDAYVARPSRPALRYVRALEARLERTGGMAASW